MTIRAVTPVPPRITQDIQENGARNLRLFLENVREKLNSLQTSVSSSGSTTTITSSSSVDLVMFIPGTLTASQLLAQIVFDRSIQFPAGLTGSYAISGVAATGTNTLTLKKNGVSIGTIQWAAAGTNATFTFSSGIIFAAGDILTITNQVTPDTTLADISISFKVTRD